ncbi:MAG: MBG domain-containing protein [Terracidiphilus sp.]
MVTLVNNGNTPLTFPALAGGNNPSVSEGFSIDSTASTACPVISPGSSAPGTIAPGATCTLTIDVAPGTFNGSLVLTDNNLNATAPNYAVQTISLSAVDAKGSPAVILTESAASLAAGQTLTLTAKVMGVPGVGAPTPEGQVTFGTLVNGTVALDSSGVATWSSSTLPAGSYTVSATYSGDSNYVTGASAPASFSVARGSVNLAAVSGQNWTGTYGAVGSDTLCVAATNASGAELSGVKVTFSGAGLSLSPSNPVTGTNGQACSSVTNSPSAGTYVASAVAAGVPGVPTFNLTVNPAPLKVELAEDSRPYGAPNPVFTMGRVHGLLNGDKITVTATTTATLASPVGYYPITETLGGPAAANYVLQNHPTLHVRKAVLTVFPDSEYVTYGQTPAPPTGYFFEGFVNGDTASVISGAPVLSTNVTSTTPVGRFDIYLQRGTLAAASYTFLLEPDVLLVQKKMLTLTANNLTMTQGGAVPPLTYTLTGFVNGDTASVVSGAPLLSTTATSSSPPGQYPITVNIGNLSAANYSFGLTANGVLTIDP